MASVLGVFQPDKMRFPDNNPGMQSMAAADARGWDVIREWAEGLPAAFGPEP